MERPRFRTFRGETSLSAARWRRLDGDGRDAARMNEILGDSVSLASDSGPSPRLNQLLVLLQRQASLQIPLYHALFRK